jgi:hypothetical protein
MFDAAAVGGRFSEGKRLRRDLFVIIDWCQGGQQRREKEKNRGVRWNLLPPAVSLSPPFPPFLPNYEKAFFY